MKDRLMLSVSRALAAVALAVLPVGCAVIEQQPQAPAFDEEAVEAEPGQELEVSLGENAPFTGLLGSDVLSAFNAIDYSVAGDVSDTEYRQTASELRDAIALHGKVRLLFRISDVSPQSFVNALDERFRFTADHSADIERMAIVSDDKTTELLTKVGGAVAPIEAQHFSRDEEDKAWAWLT